METTGASTTVSAKTFLLCSSIAMKITVHSRSILNMVRNIMTSIKGPGQFFDCFVLFSFYPPYEKIKRRRYVSITPSLFTTVLPTARPHHQSHDVVHYRHFISPRVVNRLGKFLIAVGPQQHHCCDACQPPTIIAPRIIFFLWCTTNCLNVLFFVSMIISS